MNLIQSKTQKIKGNAFCEAHQKLHGDALTKLPAQFHIRVPKDLSIENNVTIECLFCHESIDLSATN